MATTTGANALPVPQSTDTPDVVRDITNLANAVDPVLGPFVCTSTTRPASPKPGQRMVWETDTLRHSYYNGSAWYPLTRPPRCKLGNSAAQSAPQATYTVVNLDQETYDPDAMHSGTDVTKIIVTVPGLYVVQGSVSYATNATGPRLAQVWQNGVMVGQTEVVGQTSFPIAVQAYAETVCAAGDYLQLVAYQASGGALNVNAGCLLTARWASE